MIEMNRRALFGAMGAGLLLAGCRRKKDEGGKPHEGGKLEEGGKLKEGEPCGDVGVSSGESALWGGSVTRDRPLFVPGSVAFMPEYLCAAYIRFEPEGIVVRQGHAKLTGTAVGSETEQGQIAQKLLAALKNPTGPSGVTVEFPQENFENFSLNSQQVLVLFVDNDPALARFVSAADMPPATPGKAQENFMEHIVRFTQFSGEILGQEVLKNLNFAGFKAVTPALQGFDSPLAYRLDFWNWDPSGPGKPIKADKSDPDTHFRYSMNIHLRYAAKPAGSGGKSVTFPVILDPDTGNMGSNP